MEQLIPIINKLQDVFNAVGCIPIELPQLVVVGAQSSGKSSVLENIVGRDFLPRGTDIVTRRPLVLQLINTQHLTSSSSLLDNKESSTQNNSSEEKSESESSEWGEFLHKKNMKYYDFNEIKKEIQKETDRIAGFNKGVSDEPITLKIHSPNVLNLTLVDLPGITKVPVGDQPQDIEQQIRDMILRYISNPRSLIVAVSSANTDIANSDALKLAREVDPHGERTIGVLTKLDLMDRGTDALNILMGKVIPLQHGFVGIINRSQADNHQGTSIQQALKNEKQFFQNHAVYRALSSRMGTPYLAKKLSNILMQHIQKHLPEIRAKVLNSISETNAELEVYGEGVDSSDPAAAGAVLLPILTQYTQAFCDLLDGRSTHSQLATSELCGGARLSWIYHELYSKLLSFLSISDTLTDLEIQTAIRNATGPRPALFIPEQAFESLVKKQIQRLLSPSLQCLELVHKEMEAFAWQTAKEVPDLKRFPSLKDQLITSISSLLRERVQPTRDLIQSLVQLQLAYINTHHPDFIGGTKAVATVMEKVRQAKAEQEENAKSEQQSQSQQQQQAQSQQQQQQAAILSLRRNSQSSAPITSNSNSGGGLFQMLFRSSQSQPSGGSQSANTSPRLGPVPLTQYAMHQSRVSSSAHSSPIRNPNLQHQQRKKMRERERLLVRDFDKDRRLTMLPNEDQDSNNDNDDEEESADELEFKAKTRAAALRDRLMQQDAKFNNSNNHHNNNNHNLNSFKVRKQQQQQPSSLIPHQHSSKPRPASTSDDSDNDLDYYAEESSFSSSASQVFPPQNSSFHSSHASSSSSLVSPSVPAITLQHITPSDRDLVETEVIKTLLISYFGIVRKQIADEVPKAVMLSLVNATKTSIHAYLVTHIYKAELFQHLLQEGQDIAEKRKACQELLIILQKALEILNSAKEFSSSLSPI